MAISLNSIRVEAAFDAQAYVAGMRAKIAADEAGIRSDQAGIVSGQHADRQRAASGAAITALSKRYIDGGAATAEAERAVNRLGKAIEFNSTTIAQAGPIYEGIVRRTGVMADAAAVASRGNLALAEVIGQVNVRLAAHAAAIESTAAAQRSGASAAAAQATVYSQILAVTAAYGQEVDRLKTKFNPLAAAQQAYRAELRDLNAANEAGIRIQGGYAAALEKTKAAFAGQVRTTLAPTIDPNAVRERERLAAATQRYQEVLNPTLIAERAYQKEIAGVNEVAKAGLITTQQQTLLHQRYKAALDETSRAHGTTSASGRQLGFLMTNLSFQVNDVVAGLISGQAPFRILAQQGGQVFQIFQQGGSGFFGQVAATIRGWITPTTAAVAGLTAVAAGFALIVSRALDAQDRVRGFNVTLRSMGTDSLASAEELEKVVRQLRDTGSSAAEAKATVDAISRVQGINPAGIGPIANLARDIATAKGGEMQQWADDLAKALAGTADEITKFAFSIAGAQGLTVAEADEIRRLGQGADAARIAFAALAREMGGSFEKAAGPATQAMRLMKGEWGRTLDALADTSLVQGAIKEVIQSLTDLGKAIGDIAKGELKNLWKFTPLGLVVSRTADAIGSLIPKSEAAPVATEPAPRRQQRSVTWTNGLPQLAEPEAPAPEMSQARSQLLSLFWLERRGGLPPGATASMSANEPVGGFLKAAEAGYGVGPNLKSPIAPLTRSIDLSGGVDLVQNMGEQSKRAKELYVDLNATKEGYARLEAAQRELGLEGKVSVAYWTEFNAVLKTGVGEAAAQTAATIAATHARNEANIELQKSATYQDAATQGVIRITEAFKVSQAAGYAAMASEQARQQVAKEGGDQAALTSRIAEESAAAAILAGQQQVAAALPQIAAAERIAEAAKGGAAAQREAELVAAAATRTQDALAKAEASRNPVLIEQARALDAAALAEVKRSDAAKNALAIQQSINQRGDQTAVLRLQTQMVGQPPEVIAAATAHLQQQQQLLNSGKQLTDEISVNALKSVDAWSRANIELANANREWQRIEDGVRSVASTIDNTLTRSLEDAFNGNKVKSWSETIRSSLSSILAQIVNFTLIKPAIGTALGALGFGAAAQSFGSFGSLGSLFGTSGSSGTNAGTITLSPVAGQQGTFSIKQVGDVAGAGKSIFDLFGSGSGGGARTGISSFLFGSGAVNSGFAAGSGAGAGIFTELATGITSDIVPGIATAATEGISQGLLGGIGLGAETAVGSFLSSAIPFIGPALGIGSLLFGMLFSKKPSDKTSGVTFSATESGPQAGLPQFMNAETSPQLTSFVKQISAFAKNLQDITGGRAIGSVNLEYGVLKGYRADQSNIPGWEGDHSLGTDASDAAAQVMLGLAKGLEGISETMKKVIDAVTDPQQIEAAIQFAKVYENLKEAADSAFTSIDADAKKIGQFETALNRIDEIFAEITDNANLYGLSLDPVTASLAEAKRRLIIDADKTLADLILAMTDPAKAALENLKRAGRELLDDVIAVGADRVQVEELNLLRLKALWKEQAQVQSQALAQMRTGLAQLKAELTRGDISGLTGAQSVAAAQQNFQSIFDQVRGGDLSKADELATAGQDAVRQAQDVYGNAPQTARIRSAVLSAIETILVNANFANDNFATGSFENSVYNQIITPTLQPPPPVAVAAVVADVVAPVADAAVTAAQAAAAIAEAEAAFTAAWLNAIADSQMASGGDAAGSLSTPPGKRLVGELGPEWMLPATARAFGADVGQWTKIGRNGPEVINQPGGAMILPFPITPAEVAAKVAARSFAAGTDSTPPGWIQVGERGPEWLHQGGGATILPSGRTPTSGPSNAEIADLLRELIAELRGNTKVAQEHGMISERGFVRVVGALDTKPLSEAPRRQVGR